MKSYKFIVSGDVQGVFYRRSIQVHAIEAGFSGYVLNMPDGKVEVGVTCYEPQLTDFLTILRRGSEVSHVEKIEQHACDEVYEGTFEVR